jgi:hypothetical protein
MERNRKILSQIRKRMILRLIKITKTEAEALRKRYPDTFIVVVGKFAPARKKSRYVEETRKVKNFINGMRKVSSKEAFVYGK